MNTLVAIDRRVLAGATGNVVKADQFTSLRDAQEIVLQAQRHADAIRCEAAANVEALRRQVREQATQEAQAEFAASVVGTTARIEAAFVGLEGRIVNTVMNAVQQILGEVDDQELLQRIIKRALSQARSQKSLRLRVCAEQYDAVNEMIGDILRDFPEIEFVDVVKDPLGRHGLCVLESEFGTIDASLDTQVAAIRRGLADSFVGRRHGGP